MLRTERLFQAMAATVGAYKRCAADPGKYAGWQEKHEATLKGWAERHFPSGSGFDNRTQIDLERSTDEKLVFTTAFHHMDEHGIYNGWTEHTITVRPSLASGFKLTVGGRDQNDIKEHIAESFHYALSLAREVVPERPDDPFMDPFAPVAKSA